MVLKYYIDNCGQVVPATQTQKQLPAEVAAAAAANGAPHACAHDAVSLGHARRSPKQQP